MAAGDIRAGGGYIELWLQKQKLNAGLQSTTQEMKSWASNISSLGVGLTGLGTAIVAPFALSAKSFAENGARIDDFAQRTGAGVTAISELWYAADQCGTSIDALEVGFKGLAKVVSGAIHGEQESVALLQELGLTVDQIKGQSPEQIFSLIAEQIAGISDPSVKAATAMKVFGKAGMELIPLLNTGAAGIAAFRAEAARLGLSMSSEDVAAAAAFDDSLQALWSSVKGITYAVGGALVDSLKAGVDLFVAFGKPMADFIRNNKTLVAGAVAVGAAVLAAGAGLTALGLGMTLIGTAVAGLTSLAGVLTFLAVNPITWIALAATTVVGVIGYVTGGFNALYDLVTSVMGHVTQTVQGVANALKDGNVEAAWAIVQASLAIGWLTTVNYLKSIFRDFTTFVVDSMADAGIAMLDEIDAIRNDLGLFQLPGLEAARGALSGIKILNGAFAAGAAQADQAELVKAQEVFDALVQSVAPNPPTSAGQVPDIPDARDAKSGAKSREENLREDTSSTTSARGALGLGFSNVTLRTAKATEETAKNTKKIADAAANGLAFGT